MPSFSPLQRTQGNECHPPDFCALLAQSLENFTSQGVMQACFLTPYLSWCSCILEFWEKSSDYIWKKMGWIYQHLQWRPYLKRNLNNVISIVARENKDSTILFLAIHIFKKLSEVWHDEPWLEGQVLFRIIASVILFKDNHNEPARSQIANISLHEDSTHLEVSKLYVFSNCWPLLWELI